MKWVGWESLYQKERKRVLRLTDADTVRYINRMTLSTTHNSRWLKSSLLLGPSEFGAQLFFIVSVRKPWCTQPHVACNAVSFISSPGQLIIGQGGLLGRHRARYSRW